MHSSSLKSHKLIHTVEKPFECTKCEQGYTTSGNWKTHMLIHTGYKPFNCKKWENSFTESSNLSTQMLIHAGDKLFKCNICDKRFTQSANLKFHTLTNTRDKPSVIKGLSKLIIFQDTCWFPLETGHFTVIYYDKHTRVYHKLTILNHTCWLIRKIYYNY